MRIYGLNSYQPVFKAHSYEVEHKNTHIVIRTDNEKNLGQEPYLIYHQPWGEEKHAKMRKEGDFYTASVYTIVPDFKYHILYKDTGNVDLNNGKEYQINPKKMIQKLAHDCHVMHRQHTICGIKEGKAIGNIMYDSEGLGVFSEKPLNISEPTILITPKFEQTAKDPNIVGIIYTAYDCGAFSHITTQLRQATNVCGAIFEPEIIDKLISLNGKNVELEIKDGNIRFNETDKAGQPMLYPTIRVPKLKFCNKILTSKEYNPDIIGAKAVNLRRLEKLKEQGKININIPESLALPHGYILDMFDENPLQEQNYNKLDRYYICKEQADIPYKEEFCKERMDNLTQKLLDNDIIKNEDEDIMVRSSFNGEDLPNYSAAGIYVSTAAMPENRKDLYKAIMQVVRSKWSSDARFSREMHSVPDENIQYGVLLQRRIQPDYKFTLYTDDEKGNLKIDLYSNFLYDNTVNPHVFTYNKDSGILTYDSIQLENPVGEFNENQELEKIEPIENDLSDNTQLFEQLKKVAQNALIVEKEFGAPQDIEGGIKGNDIYFWQSRNIV